MEETQKPMDADPKQVRVFLFPCFAGLVRCQGMLGTEVSRNHDSIALASFVFLFVHTHPGAPSFWLREVIICD